MFQVFPTFPFYGCPVAVEVVDRMTLGTFSLADFIFEQLNGNIALCFDRAGGIERYIRISVGKDGLTDDKSRIAYRQVMGVVGDFQKLAGSFIYSPIRGLRQAA